MDFTRERLQEIREAAFYQVHEPGTAYSWVLAYNDLARAADHLDAMMARQAIADLVSDDDPLGLDTPEDDDVDDRGS